MIKQSDIEEFKAIAYVAIAVYAYNSGVVWLAVILVILATVSLSAGCIIAYYEQKIKKLKRKLEDD